MKSSPLDPAPPCPISRPCATFHTRHSLKPIALPTKTHSGGGGLGRKSIVCWSPDIHAWATVFFSVRKLLLQALLSAALIDTFY